MTGVVAGIKKPAVIWERLPPVFVVAGVPD